jgi:hypothetical protein
LPLRVSISAKKGVDAIVDSIMLLFSEDLQRAESPTNHFLYFLIEMEGGYKMLEDVAR